MTFLDPSQSPLLRKLSLLWNRIVPNWAHKKIDSHLFLPNRQTRSKPRPPRGFEQKFFKTPDGQVNAYMIGQGPAVVFVHGWGGGAHQFFSLMRGLMKCGFRAIAFDHLGHQASDNRPATLEQMIKTTNFVLNAVKKNHGEGLYGVVTHGLGATVVTNSRSGLVKDLPLFLIAPIFNYRFYFLRKLGELSLHHELLKQYAAQFAERYKRLYARLELARTLPAYSDYSVIVHDQNDPVAPYSDSLKFCDKYPLTKLLKTRNLGHFEIIPSESVWQELKSHLNYEDTTINYSNIVLEETSI
jgi:pimeloyl-ACP methyl ester carboxylesterase